MLLELALALIFAKIMDEVFMRKNQPAVIGEILVGIFFSLIVFFLPQEATLFSHTVSLSFEIEHPAFDFFAEMGIIMLLFLSGMETNLNDLKKAGKSGITTGGLGVFLTFLFVFLLSYSFFGFTVKQSVVFGTIYTATSVGVTVRTLMEIGLLNSKVGNTILTAAVADDVLGIIAITLVLGSGDFIEIAIGLVVFFFIMYILSRYNVIQRIMETADRYLRGPYALISITIGIMLLFAYFADISRVAKITGAFFVGLFIGQAPQERKIIGSLKVIAYSLFIPVFFVWVGTLVDFRILMNFNIIFLLVIPVVYVGKILGCFIGARLSGLKTINALKVGVGMVPEMEVALVIATLAYASGIFGNIVGTQIIAITIIYVIFSSITVPIMLKKLHKGDEGAR